jgi:hypothetical protein
VLEEFVEASDVTVAPLEHERWQAAIRTSLEQRSVSDARPRYHRLKSAFSVETLARAWDDALRDHLGQSAVIS